MATHRAVLCVTALVLLTSALLFSQDPLDLEKGFKPFGSYQINDIDSINVLNGNIIVNIPIMSYPQRGMGGPLNYFYILNNKNWIVQTSKNSQGNTVYRWTWDLMGGTGASFINSFQIGIQRTSAQMQGPNGTTPLPFQFQVLMPDGSKHPLDSAGNGVYTSSDNSGFKYINPNNYDPNLNPNGGETQPTTLIDSLGRTFTFAPFKLASFPEYTGCPAPTMPDYNICGSQFEVRDVQGTYVTGIADSNGNYFSFSGGAIATDTVGRAFSLTTVSYAPADLTVCPSGSGGVFTTTLPGYNGSDIVVKECYSAVPVATNFGVQGIYESAAAATAQLDSALIIIFPDKTLEWQFGYDSYGGLASITTPLGATISYTSTNVPACGLSYQYPGDKTMSPPMSRAVYTRTVNAQDGTGSHTWRYDWINGVNTVTDPLGNRIVYTVYAGNGFYGCPGYEGKTQYFDSGVQQPTKTINYDYNLITLSQDGLTPIGTMKSKQVVLDDGESWLSKYVWDSYNNLTQQIDYDYDGTVLSNTVTSYKAASDPNYLNANLLKLPGEQAVYSNATAADTSCGSGCIAKTNYFYDGASLQSAGQVPQHNSVSGVRGNLTSTQRFLISSPGSLTTSSTVWYDTGMPYQRLDAKNQPTTFTYSADYAGAYLTGTQMPQTGTISHNVSATYDLNTGLMTSFTDQNGNKSTYDYDTLSRVLSASFPDKGLQRFSYPSLTQVEGYIKLSDQNTAHSTSYYDGLGRLSSTWSDVDAQHTLKVDKTYDALGRVFTVSNPYYFQTDSTYGVTQFGYDVLGRVTGTQNPDQSTTSSKFTGSYVLTADEIGVSRVSKTDANGHLRMVCELTTAVDAAGASPTSCNDPFSKIGFTTTYNYDALGNLLNVNQGSLPQRTFTYDGLSRLLTAYNPESGQISYTYPASGSLCSGDPSAICTRTDNRFQTTYMYNDALNRLTDNTYSDPSTPSAHFQYDLSTEPNPSNTVGRLTYETTTINSVTQSRRAISQYDNMGRINLEGQCVSLSNCGGSTYTVQNLYDYAGNRTYTTNGLFGAPALTFTYNYDSASRLQSVYGSAPASGQPASALFQTNSTSYGPMGLVSASLAGSPAYPSGAISLSRSYDIRGRLYSETDTGYEPPTAAVATLTIEGAEQNNGVYATGTVSIGGSEKQSTATTSSGTITISGTEQSKQGQSQPATHSSAVIGVSGLEGYVCDSGGGNNSVTTLSNSSSIIPNIITPPPCTKIWDTGVVSLTVGSYTATVPVGQNSTSSSVAASLNTSLNASGSPVTSTVNGSTLTITSKSTGASTNYALSTACSRGGICDIVPSPPAAMSGGKDAVSGGTIYDSGTLTATINGTPASVSFSQTSTLQTLATALASAINTADGSFLTATSSGGVISLSSKQSGSGVNWPITITSSYDSGDFSSSSFAAAASGMAGGTNSAYDTGTVKVTVNGSLAYSVSYGQNDTGSTIAQALASAIGSCGGSSMVSGSASGAVLTLTSCTVGAQGNYSLSASQTYDSAHFSGGSFTPSASGGALAGGLSDQGSLTLTIAGTPQSVTFGAGSTPENIASSLAAKFSGNAQVSVNSNGPTLTITAKQTGVASDYPFSLSTTYDAAHFGSSSFWSLPASGSLSGGSNGTTSNVLYSYTATLATNGNVIGLADTTMGNWTYGYDLLNRLTSAQSTYGNYNGVSMAYPYDRYGNRWTPSYTDPSHIHTFPGGSQTFTSGLNRVDQIGPSGYDSAGNVLSTGTMSLAYDAENRVSSATQSGTTWKYVYDAEGRRVGKVTGGTLTNVYVLGSAGEQISELDGSTNWMHSNVYAGGRLLATYDSGGIHYALNDWLGTRRVQASSMGTSELSCMSLPFGENEQCSGSGSDATEHHFTGKERDSETGLDYFGARYYGSNMGRWMSPDWAASAEPVPYADLTDPQSLNLYGYVRNNPITTADLDGHAGPEVAIPYIERYGPEVGDFLAEHGSQIVNGLKVGAAILGGAIAAKLTDIGDSITPYPSGGHFGIMCADGDLAAAHREANEQKKPNPDGSKGKPDHQAGVSEEVDKARGEAGQGEQVLSNRRIQGHDSNRRPDVQIVDKNGRTRKIVEVERKPNSKRNRQREAEYNRLSIPHETKPIKKPGQ